MRKRKKKNSDQSNHFLPSNTRSSILVDGCACNVRVFTESPHRCLCTKSRACFYNFILYLLSYVSSEYALINFSGYPRLMSQTTVNACTLWLLTFSAFCTRHGWLFPKVTRHESHGLIAFFTLFLMKYSMITVTDAHMTYSRNCFLHQRWPQFSSDHIRSRLDSSKCYQENIIHHSDFIFHSLYVDIHLDVIKPCREHVLTRFILDVDASALNLWTLPIFSLRPHQTL